MHEKLIPTIERQGVEGVIEAMIEGTEVNNEIILIAFGCLQSLEMEYTNDKAFYDGCTAKNSNQDYI